MGLLPLTPEEKENIQKHEKVQTCSNISHQLRNEFARATDNASTIKTKIDESNESAENLLAELRTRKTKQKIPDLQDTVGVSISGQQEVKPEEVQIQDEVHEDKQKQLIKTKKGRERKRSEKKVSESEGAEGDEKHKRRERKKSEKKVSESEVVDVDEKQGLQGAEGDEKQ